MKNICLYFQLHQPYYLSKLSFFDLTNEVSFIDEETQLAQFNKAVENCYQPAFQLLATNLEKYPQFKFTLSFSGPFLNQALKYAPKLLENWKSLVDSGNVEVLAETDSHSLAYFHCKEQFRKQVKAHHQRITDLFGVSPKVFRNSELIYDDRLGELVFDMGYTGIITEGIYKVLGSRSPYQLFHHPDHRELTILLKDQIFSNDIAHRFSNRTWTGWPLTAKKFINRIGENVKDKGVLNLFMNLETFGCFHKKDTGIFNFLSYLSGLLAEREDFQFITPTEAISQLPAKHSLSIKSPVSWDETNRDITPWLGNHMQRESFDFLSQIIEKVEQSGRVEWKKILNPLQTSDHFYFMNKSGQMSHVHNCSSPYLSPQEAFVNYMNVLTNFNDRLGNLKA